MASHISRALTTLASKIRVARTELDSTFDRHHEKWYDWAYKKNIREPDAAEAHLLESANAASYRMEDLARAMSAIAKKARGAGVDDVDKIMHVLPTVRAKVEGVLRGLAELDGAASAVDHLLSEQAQEEPSEDLGGHKDRHYWGSRRDRRQV